MDDDAEGWCQLSGPPDVLPVSRLVGLAVCIRGAVGRIVQVAGAFEAVGVECRIILDCAGEVARLAGPGLDTTGDSPAADDRQPLELVPPGAVVMNRAPPRFRRQRRWTTEAVWQALDTANGNQRAAAEQLGISPTRMAQLIDAHGLRSALLQFEHARRQTKGRA